MLQGQTEIRGSLLALEAQFIETQGQIAARQRWDAARRGQICRAEWQDEAENRIERYQVRWQKTATAIQQNVMFWTSRNCNKRQIRYPSHQSNW